MVVFNSKKKLHVSANSGHLQVITIFLKYMPILRGDAEISSYTKCAKLRRHTHTHTKWIPEAKKKSHREKQHRREPRRRQTY